MEHKHAIVVDATGLKKEFVLVQVAEDGAETPLYYELEDGDQLVYDAISEGLALYIPRWTGAVWEETATPEEIEEIEARRREEMGMSGEWPEPGEPPPDYTEFVAGMMEGYSNDG